MLNLGLRYDVSIGSLAERIPFEPFRPKDQLKSDLLNFGPRLGLAYALGSGKTVIRGGWGKYFADTINNPSHFTSINVQTVIPETLNDGRPNFAADPYNGRPPTFESVMASGVRREINTFIAHPDLRTSYSYQGSTRMEQQKTRRTQGSLRQAQYSIIGGENHETDFEALLPEVPAIWYSICPLLAMGQTVFVLAHHLSGDHSRVLLLDSIFMDEY